MTEQTMKNITPELLELLGLSIGELTPYIEEAVLDNPFIELNYRKEYRVGTHNHEEVARKGVDPQLPETPQTLAVFLFEQIMMYRDTEIRDTMVKLIDHLDEKGYLPYTSKELAEKLAVPEVRVLDAATLLKQLEPAGVGAYDLRECLMLQTEQDKSAPNVAYYLLEDYFELLTQQNYAAIVEQSTLTHDEIDECIQYFHTLRPIPATLFDAVSEVALVAEVTIDDEKEVLQYNRNYYPELVFNQTYYDDMQALNDSEVTAYISPQVSRYKKIVDLLHQREEYVTAVVSVIWNKQKGYLQGDALQKAPLLVRHIADETRLPEPIVNTIVANKALEYHQTIYPLRDFMTVATHEGRGGLTASHVKDLIVKLITESSKPLTHAEIVTILAKANIMISERTVANYCAGIPQDKK